MGLSGIFREKYSKERILPASMTLKNFQMPPREDSLEILRKFLDKNAIKVGEGVYMGDSGRGMIKLLGDSGNVTETEPVYFNNKKVNEKYSELVKGVIN